MGLRCLLGHEYANREVEREREERGNEVVVTYRTVETCERCGERRIVSENKEVRPVRNPERDAVTTGLGDDGGVTPDLAEESASPAAERSDAAPDAAPAGDAAEDVSEAEVDADPEPEADAGVAADAPDADAPDADAPDADPVDDGIILDDEPGADADRGHGEWPAPDAETVDASEDDDAEGVPDAAADGATVVSGGEPWPDAEGEDEGFDAEPSDGTPTDVSFGGGLAPETSQDAEAAAATNGTTGAAAGKQFVAAEEVEPVTDDSAGETEFFCPNCGHARVAGGSSMRAGDICPDCHQGYIAERER